MNWRTHAIRHKYQLIVSMVPPPEKQLDLGYFRELERFLTDKGIPFANFTRYAIEHGITAKDACWPHDDHFNLKGNSEYARFLSGFVQQFVPSGKAKR